jgi:hypothetical protein
MVGRHKLAAIVVVTLKLPRRAIQHAVALIVVVPELVHAYYAY